ncbi:DUF1573 domain-containing protein [Stratiformator vulcanicus]|uniref:DUF1573 domain-containing protein n=1 Tax=Stratiformator vulcanicus TaxID=2527980 RepID=A0A517QXT7_9PLAN|nr:DUF1573 domain-containing protein [Stratiformator vulcanicus]QDT36465.1 hypothetical protein Pan189_08220 [Stratiformator vulcanicus]
MIIRARFYFCLFAGLSAGLCLPASASAQVSGAGWAEEMFSELKHDFGVVARGAETKTRIAIKNIYEEDVHILNVDTSCGCTAAKPDRTFLKTYETAYVTIEMDTRKFTRHKDSSVIVTFDRPQYAKVTIPVKMYVRTDVVLSPGSVNFGAVDVGSGAERGVEVAYAGRNDWKIERVEEDSDILDAEVVERNRGTGKATYDLRVTLSSDAPVGPIRERMTLITNDSANPNVPVLIEGRVEADITVTPSTVPLGKLTPGQTRMVNVVLRGKKPFEIEKIECESETEAFKVRLPKTTRSVHVLPLAVTAPNVPGEYVEKFTVTIPGRDEPITFEAVGEIAGS